MIELVRDLRTINVLAKFENDPWKIMDVRVLTGLVCPAARPPARPPVRPPARGTTIPRSLKGCGVKTGLKLLITNPGVWVNSLKPRDAYMRRQSIIGSDNCLSPGRCQAIIWIHVGILLIGPLGTNITEISIEMFTFSSKKMYLKMSSGKWRLSVRWINIKTSSYQYRKSHCGDKTVVRSSYLHNGISYTGKMTSLYWFAPLVSASMCYHVLVKLIHMIYALENWVVIGFNKWQN